MMPFITVLFMFSENLNHFLHRSDVSCVSDDRVEALAADYRMISPGFNLVFGSIDENDENNNNCYLALSCLIIEANEVKVYSSNGELTATSVTAMGMENRC